MGQSSRSRIATGLAANVPKTTAAIENSLNELVHNQNVFLQEMQRMAENIGQLKKLYPKEFAAFKDFDNLIEPYLKLATQQIPFPDCANKDIPLSQRLETIHRAINDSYSEYNNNMRNFTVCTINYDEILEKWKNFSEPLLERNKKLGLADPTKNNVLLPNSRLISSIENLLIKPVQAATRYAMPIETVVRYLKKENKTELKSAEDIETKFKKDTTLIDEIRHLIKDADATTAKLLNSYMNHQLTLKPDINIQQLHALIKNHADHLKKAYTLPKHFFIYSKPISNALIKIIDEMRSDSPDSKIKFAANNAVSKLQDIQRSTNPDLKKFEQTREVLLELSKHLPKDSPYVELFKQIRKEYSELTTQEKHDSKQRPTSLRR